VSDDDDVLAQMDRGFYATPLHQRLGFVVVKRGQPSIVTMELTDELRAAAPGTVHGGVLATLADVSCATALTGTYDPSLEMPVTTDMHVRYYRQPRSGPLRAEARVVHAGRRLRSAEASVADADNRVLIRATATFMMVPANVA
jgi:uncharacterized protein (TIGR00369 family)